MPLPRLDVACLVCGAAIAVSPTAYARGRGRYCSRQCNQRATAAKRRARVALICETCGGAFERVASHAPDARYCSLVCAGVARARRLNATRRPPREYARPPVRRGAANHKWVPALRFTCEQCGLEFERKPWRARGTANRFCSRPCLETFRRERESGENAPDWVGGPVTRRDRGWLRIRAQVVTEQGGNCAHCGRHVGKSLPVNHIRPFREFASAAEANQRDNLIGLCQPCHMRAERRPHRPNSRARRALASAT